MADGPAISDIVRRTAQANAKFYKGWMDLSLEYFRGISGIFGGLTDAMNPGPVQEMDAGAGALILEGEAGTIVRGTFLVSNDLERQLSCKFVGSDFRDPTGVAVKAKLAFEPAGLELGAGEQRVIQVAIGIDESFIPGVGYAGEISIGGMEGFAVPVVLRRQHRVDETPVAGDRLDLDLSDTELKTATPQSAPRKSAAKKSKGRKTAR